MMVNYFNFKKMNRGYLLTNDYGNHLFVSGSSLAKMINGSIDTSSPEYEILKEKKFIIEGTGQLLNEEDIGALRDMKSYLFSGTSLHIFVMTDVCNMNCVYCQAKSPLALNKAFMSLETGKKAIEVALQSPSESLVFEFQGGEPLLNFGVIKSMVEYAEEIKGSKQVHYTIVSNLIALTDEILDFFEQYSFQVSTSLDGPENVHNTNRRHNGPMSSFEHVVRGIEKIQERGISTGAIQTTTRNSLQYPEEIVRTYVEMGLHGIFIRPLTPLGCAKDRWEEVGYSPEEFVEFYGKCLDYIIEINKQGMVFPETFATLLLRKIINRQSENYMELRSPCGAGVGQLAYNYDGDVYTCDEGRMVAEAGDKAFKLGNVNCQGYDELMNNPVCKTTILASVTESIPSCADCVYQAYCGICPVVSYAMEHNIFPKSPRGYKCRINSGIMDILFEKIYSNEENLVIFKKWLE